MFYAVYFFKTYPKINKIKISYVYVEHEECENSMILERQYLDNYIKELHDLIKSAENETSFPKNECRLCDYCEYKEHCDTED